MTTVLRWLGISSFCISVVSSCATSPPGKPPSAVIVSSLPPALDPRPEVVLKDVALARANLMARIVIAAPKSIVSDLNALSDHLSFPIKFGDELRSRIGALGDPLATHKLLQLTEKLDPLTPPVVVWLLGPRTETRGFCAALTFGDVAHVLPAFSEFGREQSSQDGISERLDRQGNRLFVAAKGRTLLVANAPETLRSGGALAMEPGPSSDHVAMSFWPEVFAKGSGLSTKMLAAFLIRQLDTAKSPAGETMTPALRRMLATAMEMLAQYFLETETISLFATIDSKTGIVLRTELRPRATTAFADLASQASPYAFDQDLPVQNDGTWVGAWGHGELWTKDVTKLIRASGPAGERLGRAWLKFFGEHTGNGSCTIQLSGQPSTWCSFTLRHGVSPLAGLEALTDYLSAQSLWSAEMEGRKAVPPKVKRFKDSVIFEQKIEGATPQSTKLLKALFGGNFLRIKATAKDGKLYLLQSGQVTALSRIIANEPSQPTPPIIAQTFARTAGADFMFSFEPASLVLNLLPKFGSNEMTPYLGLVSSLPGIESLHLPFVFSWRSGGVFKGELSIPLKGLESLSQVIRGVMGSVNQ